MFLGFLNPFQLKNLLKRRAALRRYQRRPGPKETLELVRLHAACGDRPRALAVLQEARMNFPHSADLKRLHECLLAQAAGEEIRALERLVRMGGRIEDHARLIELHRSVKNFDRSIRVAQEADRRFPDSWILKLAAGKALFHQFLLTRSQEQGQKAAECLRQARKLKPDCARAILYLAALLAELGLRSQAVACAEELIRIAPGSVRAKRLRERLAVAPRKAEAPAPPKGKRAPGAAPKIPFDPELLSDLMQKLQGNPAIYGSFLFDSDGSSLHSHVGSDDIFTLENHQDAIAALARSAQGATEKIGIGHLQTCVIEGNPWRIYIGELSGKTLMVFSDRAFSVDQFETLANRYSMNLVER